MTRLIIDPYRSYCGACNKNADPLEKAHLMHRMEGEGCGAKYTSTGSHYYDFEGLYSSIMELRPDLPFHPGPAVRTWMTDS